MIKPLIRLQIVGCIETNCYTVKCPETGAVIIIDPGDDSRLIEEGLTQLNAIVYTHGHFDHVGGAAGLLQDYNAPTMIHSGDVGMLAGASLHAVEWGFRIKQPPPPSRILRNGDTIKAGSMQFEVIHTPGHSQGSICIMGHGLLFSGDTLFAGSVGRTDLPGSSDRDMQVSLQHIVSKLDDNLLVYPGHGRSTTVLREKKSNPFLINL